MSSPHNNHTQEKRDVRAVDNIKSGSQAETPRRQLPSLPDTQAQLISQTTEHALTGPAAGHAYGPYFLEYSLLAEYNQVQKQKLPGVYVIPSAKSPLLWYGMLFIRMGMYQGGVFKFSLHVPDNYPDGECPRFFFDLPIFHPIINPVTCELDVKRAFQKWRRNVNHLWHVLLYARRVFYKIDITSPSNPEAAVLYEQDLDLYKSRVTDSIQLCKDKLYEDSHSNDPHAIRFSAWDPEIHGEALQQMMHQQEMSLNEGKTSQLSGLSWMDKGSCQIFSHDDSASL